MVTKTFFVLPDHKSGQASLAKCMVEKMSTKVIVSERFQKVFYKISRKACSSVLYYFFKNSNRHISFKALTFQYTKVENLYHDLDIFGTTLLM